jgi:TetR/AcrR family transcriptional regulator, mexJK operon transcriptional repressor
VKVRGRGRPDVETAEAMTGDILDAAEALFLRQGYGVSLKAVSSAAGVSRTALYARFPTKEALLIGVVERLVDKWSGQTRLDGMERGLPLNQRLYLIASRTLRVMATAKAQQLERLVQSQATRSPALIALVEHLGIHRGVSTFAEVISGDPGSADDPRARRAALVLIQMLVGWMGTTDGRSTRSVAAQDKAARYFVDILLSGQASW